ncbi:uncharacterized protein LOC132741220 [Ruditapes philippinarum]|uniref:uncharacterized protein LOC132741220 n=1 Tax=Ruditapes philippinarum TaxID=129788 RepID=UPI00295B99EF|nr:uncharacterized protein LOC132741220 [Ruditapes philippinarum]
MSRQVGARKRQKYDTNIIEKVVPLIRNKSISMSRASKEYGIPKSTLHDHVHNKYQNHSVGVKPVLSKEEEERVAKWAVHMSKIGFGRTRQELALTIKKIIDEDGRPNPFKDNKPGTRGKDFRKYIEDEVGDKDLLSDPSRIYNADESGFSFCLKGNQVIGYKGAPVIYHFGNSDKSQLTVMAAVSATAHYVPPMIIFPGQRFSYDPLEGFPEAAIGRSDNGWMDTEVFCNWLLNVFIPAINERRIKKPVLLLIDGHKTHVTMQASDICVENGVELYCLLEHASHVMQPLDLRLFSQLKRTWRQAVRDWQSEHIGEFVTKKTFARVFKQAWEKSTTVEVAVKGFQEAGLFPLDQNAVLSSVKLDPSMLFGQNSSSESKDIPKEADKLSRSEDASVDDLLITEIIFVLKFLQILFIIKCMYNYNLVFLDKDPEIATIAKTVVTPAKVPQTLESSNQLSPFSKFLKFPECKQSSSRKRPSQPSRPKAVTGAMYREILQKKLKAKEEFEQAKKQRQKEREKKRQKREEEKERKKIEP